MATEREQELIEINLEGPELDSRDPDPKPRGCLPCGVWIVLIVILGIAAGVAYFMGWLPSIGNIGFVDFGGSDSGEESDDLIWWEPTPTPAIVPPPDSASEPPMVLRRTLPPTPGPLPPPICLLLPRLSPRLNPRTHQLLHRSPHLRQFPPLLPFQRLLRRLLPFPDLHRLPASRYPHSGPHANSRANPVTPVQQKGQRPILL